MPPAMPESAPADFKKEAERNYRHTRIVNALAGGSGNSWLSLRPTAIGLAAFVVLRWRVREPRFMALAAIASDPQPPSLR